MPDIPNVIGHIVGPLIWLLFIAIVAWYVVRGAIVERGERAPAPARERATSRPRRRDPADQTR